MITKLKQLFIILGVSILLITTFNSPKINAAEISNNINVNEEIAIKDGATGFFIHDIGTDNNEPASLYEPLNNGTIITRDSYMEYNNNNADDSNGIKIDVTDYIKKGKSGNVYGASLAMGVRDWQSDEPAKMFFEVISDSSSDIYELTTASSQDGITGDDTSNIIWHNGFVKGSTNLMFSQTDKIFLCINQRGNEQMYDRISLWGLLDEYKDPENIKITTPEYSQENQSISFVVTNLTATDISLNISVGDTVEQSINVLTGTENSTITFHAASNSPITIFDNSGNIYFDKYIPTSFSWVSTWASAIEKVNQTASAMPVNALDGTTIRQPMRVSTGGTRLRLRITNQYGKEPLVIKSMHIAKQINVASSEIDTSTDTVITFNNGDESLTLNPGATIISDPVEYRVAPLENLAVSTYYESSPAIITGHRCARSTQYQMQGNHVSNKLLDFYTTATSWCFVSDIAVLSPEGSKAIVCFGDSITDGYGTDLESEGGHPDNYGRWSDFLASRLQADNSTSKLSVLNEGIGANSLLGSWPTDAGKDRFKRDVLEHDGVKYVIVHFGVNDISGAKDTSKLPELLKEFGNMVTLCHENNIKIFAAPILPFKGGWAFSEAGEELRQSINNWMRSDESGFDGIIDFITPLAESSDINKLQAKFTNDFLHPVHGYDVMANSIDLSLFN